MSAPQTVRRGSLTFQFYTKSWRVEGQSGRTSGVFFSGADMTDKQEQDKVIDNVRDLLDILEYETRRMPASDRLMGPKP